MVVLLTCPAAVVRGTVIDDLVVQAVKRLNPWSASPVCALEVLTVDGDGNERVVASTLGARGVVPGGVTAQGTVQVMASAASEEGGLKLVGKWPDEPGRVRLFARLFVVEAFPDSEPPLRREHLAKGEVSSLAIDALCRSEPSARREDGEPVEVTIL